MERASYDESSVIYVGVPTVSMVTYHS